MSKQNKYSKPDLNFELVKTTKFKTSSTRSNSKTFIVISFHKFTMITPPSFVLLSHLGPVLPLQNNFIPKLISIGTVKSDATTIDQRNSFFLSAR